MWYFRLIKYAHVIILSCLVLFTATNAEASVVTALIIIAKVAWTIVTTTAYLAVSYGVYVSVGYSLYKTLTADDSEGSSNTYGGSHSSLTVESGTTIAWGVGLIRVAGNIIRQNDINDAGTTFIKVIVCHGEGEWSEILGHYLNDEPWDDVTKASSAYYEHLGTATQSGVTNVFDIENYNYRNKVVTEYKIKRGGIHIYLRNINVVAKACKCLEIGESSGGASSWTRNPAQILWHYYIEKEHRTAAELDTNAFTALESYCAASLSYIDEYQSHIFPPILTEDRVKATSVSNTKFFSPRFSIMKKSIKDSDGKKCSWVSSSGSVTNQRLNIDFGRSVVVTALEIENGWTYSDPTYTTNVGIHNFTLQGSNTASDFNSTTYTDVGKTWVEVAAGLAATEHAASTATAFQTIAITNHTAYRYYSLKMADNFGNANYMMIRGVRFLGGGADSSVATEEYNNRYTFDYNFDTKIECHDAKKLIWNSFHGRCIQSQGKIKPIWEGAQEHDGAAGLQNKAVQHAFVVDTNVVSGSFNWHKIEKYNIFIINFLDSANEFKKDCVVMRNTDDIAARGEVVYEETCWFLIDRASAKRRCRRAYNKSWYTDYECTLTGFPDSQALEIYDRVTVTDTEAGWSAKDFLVLSKDEDQYGRPTFVLGEYFSGIYSDQGFEEQPNFGTNPLNSMAAVLDIDASTVSLSVVAPAAGDKYVAGSVHVTFTPPPTATMNEIWLSTDDTNYYLAATDVDGDVYIPGLGVLYDTGDTVYVKIVAISASGVKTELPTTYMDSVAIPSTGTLVKLASFYAGLYDLWGGNSAIGNAATTIVLGNLDGTPKLALGASADTMTLANAATYPGFFVDGNGYFRAGSAAHGVNWNGTVLDINGDIDADHFLQDGTVITGHVADDNITRSWSYYSTTNVDLPEWVILLNFEHTIMTYTESFTPNTAYEYFVWGTFEINASTLNDYTDRIRFHMALLDNLEIVSDGVYKWTVSGSGTNEYYLTNEAGTGSGLSAKPSYVFENAVSGGGDFMVEGTVGALTVGQWDWDDNDGLGFSTVYVRLTDEANPDGKADGYVRAGKLIREYVSSYFTGYMGDSGVVRYLASPSFLTSFADTKKRSIVIVGAYEMTNGKLSSASCYVDSMNMLVLERKGK